DGAVQYRAVFVFDFITRQLPRLYISQLDKLTIQGIFVPFLQQCGGCLMGRFERRARHSGRSRPVPCVLLAGLFTFFLGCGGGGQADVQPPPPPPAADFALAFAPATVTVAQGSTSSPVSVSVTASNGFSGQVQVSLGALPSGITANPASPFSV